jgi:pilus assembly protein CpaE
MTNPPDRTILDTGIDVLLIEDNIDHVELVKAYLESAESPFRIRWTNSLEKAIEHLAGAGDADVVLMDLGLSDARDIEGFARLRQAAPWVPVVILTSDLRGATETILMAKGAQDYLRKPSVSPGELARALRNAILRRQPDGASQIAPASGRIIGMVGAKGGVGTTTVTLNVAAALAQEGAEVLAIELSGSLSGFAWSLGQARSERAAALHLLDNRAVTREVLEEHAVESSFGPRILFGARSVDGCEEARPEAAAAILQTAAKLAEFVVADLGCQPSPATRTAIRACDYITLIVDREPVAIAAGRAWVEALRRMDLSNDRFGAVLVNRSSLMPNKGAAEIAGELGCQILGVLPTAAEFLLSAAQRREPLVCWESESLMASSIIDTARRLACEPPLPLTLV